MTVCSAMDGPRAPVTGRCVPGIGMLLYMYICAKKYMVLTWCSTRCSGLCKQASEILRSHFGAGKRGSVEVHLLDGEGSHEPFVPLRC